MHYPLVGARRSLPAPGAEPGRPRRHPRAERGARTPSGSWPRRAARSGCATAGRTRPARRSTPTSTSRCGRRPTSSTAEFFLAQVGPEHAGKSMVVTLWDPAEGGKTLRIQRPTGSQHLGRRDLRLGVERRRQGGQRRDQHRRRRQQLQQPTCSPSPSTSRRPTRRPRQPVVAHRLRVRQAGGPTDRTTWSVSLEGEPGPPGRLNLGRTALFQRTRVNSASGVTFRGRRPMKRAVVLSRHDGARSAGGVDGACRRERGATLVEAAIITPLFFLLIFGIIEVGGAYKDKLAIGNAVTAGARTGSASADDALADYNILIAVEKALAARRSQRDRVHRRLQRRVGPTACRPQGARPDRPTRAWIPPAPEPGPATCTRPRRSTRTRATSGARRRTASTSTTARRAARWCSPRPTAARPTWSGVWIKMHHAYYTKFIADSVTLTDQAVIAVEPRRL